MKINNDRIWDLLDDMQHVLAGVVWLFMGLFIICFIASVTIDAFANESATALEVTKTEVVETTPEPPAEKLEIKQEVASDIPEPEQEPIQTTLSYSKDWDSDDDYLLAKIAMAEAEGESLECKIHIILVVLNRVHDSRFPNTIEEVIFQNYNGVYQFTPIGNGRWDKIEPNEECWEALKVAKQLDGNISMGALYFESCKDPDNWHSRNLEYLFNIDGTRFYR